MIECVSMRSSIAATTIALLLQSLSLWLEERCVESERASTALKACAIGSKNTHSGSNKKNQCSWLPKEREKLRRTTSCKEDANDCFRRKEHAPAALKYEGVCVLTMKIVNFHQFFPLRIVQVVVCTLCCAAIEQHASWH